tara:strand:- start:40568 stop:42238 length:1671 start_codon:yes stop_codon:yes gene_type:complete
MSSKSNKYLGNANLKSAGVNINFSPEQIEEYMKCANDPLYFIANYVKIVSLDKGLVPFTPYDFQEDMIESVHKNRFVIMKCPRQSGKSTTMVSYLLHYILFNQNMSVAILANKLSTARELLGRLKLAYEYLPMWLQQGVVEWNKGSIVLENGSKALAAATSSSAVRGGSYNCIMLDEFAYVPQNVAEEFFSSVYPTITSGKDTKVIIVSTPKGLNMFYRLWVNATKKPGEEGKNEYYALDVHWRDVPGRDDEWKKQTIANTSVEQFRTEFETEFLGSMHTLVAPEKLKCLVYRTPEYLNNEGLRIYQRPIPDHKYIMVVDTARGQGQDYHAFSVVDVSCIPYRVVATFRNNMLAPMLYPNAIYPIARQYNNAYTLVEINDIGGQVADILHDELEYDNIIYVSMQGRKGQVVNGGFGAKGSSINGVKTSTAVKRIGCSILKNLIEDTKLIVEDFNTVDELTTFVAKGDSFEAEDNHHDDLAMTLVLFSWLTTQAYFKSITGSDIRKDLYEEQIKNLEEEMTPFGFVDDGDAPAAIVDDRGTVWRGGTNENLDMGWTF